MPLISPVRTGSIWALCLSATLVSLAGAATAQAPASVQPAAGKAGSVAIAPGRPDADKARDADRKPVEMLAFAKVKRGQVIVDYLPGKGYFTRLFSDAVGPNGAVYAQMDQLLIDRLKGKPLPPPVSGEPGRGNVHEGIANAQTLGVPVKADLVWTAQNYHDVHNWAGAAGTAALNKAVFAALKPGGLYVIVDHKGLPGLDDAGMAKLHRIDEALVKKEVEAVGFKLDGESQALANPADPHDVAVFDPSIRGKTDQFVLRFRKPISGGVIATSSLPVEDLVASAALDFDSHRPPDSIGFRRVRIGHVITRNGSKQYMLCGEFLASQANRKAKWIRFITIKTSGHEQWLGDQADSLCRRSSIVWDSKMDLSSSLRDRFDSLKTKS